MRLLCPLLKRAGGVGRGDKGGDPTRFPLGAFGATACCALFLLTWAPSADAAAPSLPGRLVCNDGIRAGDDWDVNDQYITCLHADPFQEGQSV